MKMLELCIEYLKKSRVLYAHSIEPPAWAATDERPPMHGLATTVLYMGDAGYGMIVAPEDATVDLAEVGRLLGLKAIRRATESEAASLFPDCDPAAIPAFGNLFDIPVLMDETLAVSDYIAFRAGTPRDIIHIRGIDFHNLVEPLVAPFAVRAELTPQR